MKKAHLPAAKVEVLVGAKAVAEHQPAAKEMAVLGDHLVADQPAAKVAALFLQVQALVANPKANFL